MQGRTVSNETFSGKVAEEGWGRLCLKENPQHTYISMRYAIRRRATSCLDEDEGPCSPVLSGHWSKDHFWAFLGLKVPGPCVGKRGVKM